MKVKNRENWTKISVFRNGKGIANSERGQNFTLVPEILRFFEGFGIFAIFNVEFNEGSLLVWVLDGK